MKIAVVTLFPDLFASFLEASLLGKAIEAGRLQVELIDPREFTRDVHRTVDDAPYGGGAGMILKPEPLAAAIQDAEARVGAPARSVLLTPQGRPLSHARVAELAEEPALILICGRYEGVDERIRARVDEEISLGDFVLSGGEVAAMALIDAVSRLVPEVLGNRESLEDESFSRGLLEYPQYTRPPLFEGQSVPDVLRSGDHGRVAEWRRAQSLWRTKKRRPDLFDAFPVTPEDEALMERHPPDRDPE